MKTFWENDGEPDASGHYAASIDLEDGSGVQRFMGKSHKEVADKLLVSQGNATKKIREMTRSQEPEPAKPATAFERKPLTADERFKLVQDINDPTKAPEAIKKVVESEVGSLDKMRERRTKEETEERARVARSEAEQFAAETSDYYVCDHNARVIASYMSVKGWAFVKDNFARAFEDLKNAGLVVFKPETDEGGNPPQPESAQPNGGGLPAQPTVTIRPRGVISSTGLRSGDSNGVNGKRTPAQRLTVLEIEQMSQSEYKRRSDSEPGFLAAVDAAYAATTAKR